LDTGYFETDPPIPKDEEQVRPYDGVPIGPLLRRVTSVLRAIEKEQS